MLVFVWSHKIPLYSGRGGSESYTIGQLRELKQRGIPAKIVTVGLGKNDGREYFPDIKFESIDSINELAGSEDTVIFINLPHPIKINGPSFVMMHVPPLPEPDLRPDYADEPPDYSKALKGHDLIVNSRFLRDLWAGHLGMDLHNMQVVYPFADPAFAKVKRPTAKKGAITKVLFAGRLHPEKGIYTLLEALHHPLMRKGYEFSVTSAGHQTEEGQVIESLLKCHPWVKTIPARHTPEEMAQLFSEHQVVVMPSNHTFWHEAFGMVSVEAQHAGCWVVASNDAGLPETDCGSLSLFEPGNSYALAKTIQMVSQGGPASSEQRERTFRHFTRKESVDSLLAVINGTYGKKRKS